MSADDIAARVKRASDIQQACLRAGLPVEIMAALVIADALSGELDQVRSYIVDVETAVEKLANQRQP